MEISSEWSFSVEKGFEKSFRKIDQQNQKKIRKFLGRIHVENIMSIEPNFKYLTNAGGMGRFKFGQYRILADIDFETHTIYLVYVGTRQNCYDYIRKRQ